MTRLQAEDIEALK